MATYTTLDDAYAAYLANADYAETASLTKAKLFASACRALLLTPRRGRQGDVEIETDPAVLREQLAAATQYVNDSTAGSGAMMDVSFEEFRT